MENRWTATESIAKACLLALLLCAPNACFGQARDTASLFGTVTDAQAAVVPGARVIVTNIATGLTRTAATDAERRIRLFVTASRRLLACSGADGFPQIRAARTSCFKRTRMSKPMPRCRSAMYRRQLPSMRRHRRLTRVRQP